MLKLCRTPAPVLQQLRVQRCFSTDTGIKNAFKSLLRDSAQPVAVVTARMPGDRESENTSTGAGSSSNLGTLFHGATLSSFSSIALEPHPLISFSLRTPSRMALALMAERPSPDDPHMVINMLSSAQADLAIRFSRPDRYSDPFESVPIDINTEGLPVLRECVGALACRLVSRIPLWDLEVTGNENGSRDSAPAQRNMSNLFIARVLRIEPGHSQHLQPLVYHRQGYTTVQPIIKAHD